MNPGGSPVLLLVDVQQGFDEPSWGARNQPDAEHVMHDLLAHWRRTRLPVVHVRHASTNPHSTLHPTHPGFAFKDEVRPAEDEKVIEKSVNSAFIGTDLEQHLHAIGADTLVVVGLTTDHCVSTTVRMAANLGFRTFVVADATATFDRSGPDGRHFPAELLHDTALASLHDEFATVVRGQELIRSLPSPG